MKVKSVARLAVLSAIASGSASAWSNSYTIVDLGNAKQPEAINSAHEVVAYRDGSFVWSEDKWHPVKPKPSIAVAINDRGDLAGEMNGFPAIWPKRGQAYNLDLPAGAASGMANAILHDKTATGTYTLTNGAYRCFVTDSQGITSDLGDQCVDARGVNSAHRVVGTMIIKRTGFHEGFVWFKGEMHSLEALPNGVASWANGINSSGQIVGQAAWYSALHAVQWNNGAIEDLGIDENYYESNAVAISDAGQIVGSATSKDDKLSHGVRFAGGEIIDLATEVSNLDDWFVGAARAVSSDGVIVGVGTRDYNGRRQGHAYMLIPQ